MSEPLQLKIKADTAEAVKGVQDFKGEVVKTGDAAKGADDHIKSLGEAVQSAQKRADKAEEDIKALNDALQKSQERSAAAEKKVEELHEEIKKLGERSDDASEKSGDFATKLNSVLEIGQKVGQVLSGAFAIVSESIANAAEHGDEMAQEVVGEFDAISASSSRIGAAISKDMAPALDKLIPKFDDAAKAVGGWIDEHDIGQEVLLVALKTLLIIGTAVEGVNRAYENGKAKVKDWYEGHDPGRLSTSDEKLLDMAHNADELAERMGAGANAARDLRESIQETDPDSIAALAAEAYQAAQATKSANSADKDWLATLADLIQEIEAGTGKLEHHYRARKEGAEAAKEALEQQLAYEKLEHEELKASEEDKERLHQHAIDRADAAARAVEDQILREEDARQAGLEGQQSYAEAIQASIDEQLAAIDALGLGEEEAGRRRIAILQQVAKTAGTTAKQRLDAEKKVQQEQKKLHDQEIAETKKYTDKVSTITTEFLTGLIIQRKSFSSVMLGIVLQLAQELIGAAVKMAVGSIAAGSAEASAHVAFAGAKAAASRASIPPSVAAAYAPIPFSQPLAAAALAFYQGMAALGGAAGAFGGAKAGAAGGGAGAGGGLGFADGGRVQDRVPGLGRQDTVPGVLAADEGVLTGRGMQTTIGEVLGAINRGLPAGGQGGGGGQVISLQPVIHIHGPVLDSPERYAVELGPVLSRALNIWVRDFGGQLYATGLAEGRGR